MLILQILGNLTITNIYNISMCDVMDISIENTTEKLSSNSGLVCCIHCCTIRLVQK